MNIFRQSLKWKLLVLQTLVVLLTALSIGFFSYFDTSRTIQDDIRQSGNKILKQATLNLNRYLKDYENYILMLGTSREYQNWLNVEAGDALESHLTLKLLEDAYMQRLLFQSPEILSISLYNSNGNERNYSPQTGLSQYYSIRQEPWFHMLAQTTDVQMFMNESQYYMNAKGQPVKLQYFTLVKSFTMAEAEGLVKFDISLQPTIEILQEIKISDAGLGLIINEDGHVLVQPDSLGGSFELPSSAVSRIREGDSSGSFYLDETKQMYIYETIPSTGWKVLSIVPYREIAKSIYRVRNVTLFVTVVSLVISLLLVTGISSSVTRRVRNLQNFIKNIPLGRFEARASVEGEDEIANLARAYNNMLQHLEMVIEQLAQTRIVQQGAVVAALQSQINSHFLYNALESIKSMAHLADRREIAETTLALSDMLRYTSNYKDKVVSIRDEICHLENYLHIMKLEYGEDLSFEVDMKVDLWDAACLKSMIQPIAENSIKHGIDVTGMPLCIRIELDKFQDQYLRLRILDNGQGFNQEQLLLLQEKLSARDISKEYDKLTHVGLLNVHYRLLMYAQDNFSGIYISNQSAEGGACVDIIYPIRELKGEGYA